MDDDVETRAKTVLITGTSSGIGEASAIALHERGFHVFAGVRRAEDGDRLVTKTSSKLTPILLDVTNEEAIATAATTIAEATNEHGLDALVNNAGITIAFPLEFLPMETLRQQFDVNFFGVAAVTQAFLPMLREAKGRIVNISSVSGLTAAPYVGAYASSKHALEAYSDSLRVEIRNFGIDVSLVEPADIDTPIWEKSRGAADELRDRRLEEVSIDSVAEYVRDTYAADIKAMRASTEKMAANALPVSKVVDAVVSALTSKRPKPRYRIGAKTWAVKFLLRQLPERLRDKIVCNQLGMK